MAIPVAYAAMNRSLITSISFAMSFIAMTAGYTFSISEKSDMDRLYGVLPIDKRDLVLGKYLYTFCMGLSALIFSIIVHPIVLRILDITVQTIDICMSAILGSVLFTLYTVFQLPGYYKYGSIKGRIFMYIPIAGLLAVILFVAKLDISSYPIASLLINSPIISAIIILLICLIFYLLSIRMSIQIIRKKDNMK